MTLGDRIKERRKYMRITAKEMASLLGISPSTYYKYENDTVTVPADRLDRIAETLNVSVEYLKEETKRDDTAMIPIPVVRVSDGETTGYVGIPSSWTSNDRRYMAVAVEDDSLYPICAKGGVVILRLIREGEEIKPRDFVAARIGGKLRIGRYSPVGGMFCLYPANTEYDVSWDEEDKVDPVGFVIETRSYWQ